MVEILANNFSSFSRVNQMLWACYHSYSEKLTSDQVEDLLYLCNAVSGLLEARKKLKPKKATKDSLEAQKLFEKLISLWSIFLQAKQFYPRQALSIKIDSSDLTASDAPSPVTVTAFLGGDEKLESFHSEERTFSLALETEVAESPTPDETREMEEIKLLLLEECRRKSSLEQEEAYDW